MKYSWQKICSKAHSDADKLRTQRVYNQVCRQISLVVGNDLTSRYPSSHVPVSHEYSRYLFRSWPPPMISYSMSIYVELQDNLFGEPGTGRQLRMICGGMREHTVHEGMSPVHIHRIMEREYLQ